MAIKRYIADADNTITNAFLEDLSTRATGSNMGASDILEVFTIYGQGSGSAGEGKSTEISRILIKFPVGNISEDRTNSLVPASGSVSFYLKMYNARHSQTTPRDFTLDVTPVNRAWQEGTGMDMNNYSDLVHDKPGSNWMSASSTAGWTIPGGDFYTGSWGLTASFDIGNEDVELDITELVEEWIGGDQLSNYGICLKFTSSQEPYFSSSAIAEDNGIAAAEHENGVLHNLTGSYKSYYTKKFFGRGTEFFYSRPAIEARWDSSTRDDRGQFYYSSSLAPPEENMNTLYLYNYVRGRLRNIPAIEDGNVYVDIYKPSNSSNEPSGTPLTQVVREASEICSGLFPATGGWVSTGIYSCSVGITGGTTPDTLLLDVWHGGDAGETYFTGTIYPKTLEASHYNPGGRYVTTMTNLRPIYSPRETARFRLHVREKDWSPTIYTKASKNIENTTIDSGSYRIFRITDELEVIPHNTGSDLATFLSFDVTGNYFDLEVALLEKDYAYGIGLAYYNGSIDSWVEQSETFKFRVE